METTIENSIKVAFDKLQETCANTGTDIGKCWKEIAECLYLDPSPSFDYAKKSLVDLRDSVTNAFEHNTIDIYQRDDILDGIDDVEVEIEKWFANLHLPSSSSSPLESKNFKA